MSENNDMKITRGAICIEDLNLSMAKSGRISSNHRACLWSLGLEWPHKLQPIMNAPQRTLACMLRAKRASRQRERESGSGREKAREKREGERSRETGGP